MSVPDKHGRPPPLVYVPARVTAPPGSGEAWPLNVYRLRDAASAMLSDEREAWDYDLGVRVSDLVRLTD